MADEKRIRQRKTLKPFTKKYDSPKVGRKPSVEKELTEEQKKFAIMVSRGLHPDFAGGELGWTPYMVKTYADLPKMKTEIQKWQDIFGVEQKEKYCKMGDMVVTEALHSLIRRLREDKLTEANTMKLAQWAMQQGLGMNMEGTPMPAMEQIEKTTTKLRRTYQPSELKSAFDHPDFQDDFEGETPQKKLPKPLQEEEENECQDSKEIHDEEYE